MQFCRISFAEIELLVKWSRCENALPLAEGPCKTLDAMDTRDSYLDASVASSASARERMACGDSNDFVCM